MQQAYLILLNYKGVIIMMGGYRFHVQFHITNRCNLKCKHCYEGNFFNVEEWEIKNFKSAIEKLWNCFKKWGVKGEISLIGGEPTLHPQFYDMVNYLSSRGDVTNIAVLTNGVLLDSRFIESMQKNNCFVQISLDGVSAKKHDFIRGEGSYDKTINNIMKLCSAGVPVGVHYVLSKYTTPLNSVFFANLIQYGVSQITFSRLVPLGNAGINDMLNKDELKNTLSYIDEMRKVYEPNGLLFGTTRPLWCHFGHTGKCPAGIQTITILENGDILPCRRLPIKVGNIYEDNFYKIWYTNNVLERLRNRQDIKICGTCKFLEKCGGARCIANAVSGDFMEADPQCWII